MVKTRRQLILDALAVRPLTRAELMMVTPGAPARLHFLLALLERDGAITNPHRGVYACGPNHPTNPCLDPSALMRSVLEAAHGPQPNEGDMGK